jgi:hypothetical protein
MKHTVSDATRDSLVLCIPNRRPHLRIIKFRTAAVAHRCPDNIYKYSTHHTLAGTLHHHHCVTCHTCVCDSRTCNFHVQLSFSRAARTMSKLHQAARVVLRQILCLDKGTVTVTVTGRLAITRQEATGATAETTRRATPPRRLGQWSAGRATRRRRSSARCATAEASGPRVLRSLETRAAVWRAASA